MLTRSCSIIIHALLTILFIYYHPQTLIIMLMAPILHFLVVKYDSFCYQQHCHTNVNRMFKQQRLCEICGLDQWIRMRHCYKCMRCVHKFDHHCVLMGICIGEFNHKYYVAFLYFFLINEIIMLHTFHSAIGDEVTIDEFGLETLSFKYWLYAFSIIALYFFTFIAIYLTYYHTKYMLNNQTTWQRVRRDSISYFKSVRPQIKYPFSQGYIANIKQFLSANTDNPIDWKVNH